MMFTVFFPWPIVQVVLHSGTGNVGKFKIKMAVDFFYLRDGITDNVAELHIEEAALPIRHSLALRHTALYHFGKIFYFRQADGYGIDIITKGAVQGAGKAGGRAHYIHGRAVSLNNGRVGVLIDDAVKVGEVGRGFQYPAFFHIIHLQVLQKVVVPLVSRAHVLV